MSIIEKLSKTRGGENQKKYFLWGHDERLEKILIINEGGKIHEYPLQEIKNILISLYEQFGEKYFPLANNVKELGKGTERPGLGTTILEQKPGDFSSTNIYHAQGSSYLGVVMEECGYFKWNGEQRGIEWRLSDHDFSRKSIITRLKSCKR